MSLPEPASDNTEQASVSESFDRFLPSFHWRIFHRVSCNAAPTEAYRALVLWKVRHPVLTFLLKARGLSAKGSLKEFFVDNGFVVLEENPPIRFVVGLVARPWRADGGLKKIRDLHSWETTGLTDDVRIVAMFGVRSSGPGRVDLITETRIHAQSRSARMKFAVYWTFVRPFSGIVRRLWLQSAARSVRRIKP
jgi:hypothetical protein